MNITHLEVAHGVKCCEEEHERGADNDDVLPNVKFLIPNFVGGH